MTRDFTSVAGAVLRRNLIHAFKNPALLIPSIVFPLLFFVAFAGGLSSVGNVPGFDFPSGYTAFQFVFVFLQSAAFGGVFTGFAAAGDFESGFGRRLLLASRGARGSSPGYALAAMARCSLTATVVSVAALIAGMQVDGGLAQLVALRLARAAGQPHRHALGRRHGAALPVAAGGAGDADPRLPDPVHGAGLRAARPDQRLGPRRRVLQPAHGAARSRAAASSPARPTWSGSPTSRASASSRSASFWALTGLRRAERGV